MKVLIRAAAALLTAPLVLAAQSPTPTKAPAGAFDPGKSYAGVQTQQGRVLTDADWNSQLQACKRENEAFKKQMKSRANELEMQLLKAQAAADKADQDKKNAQDHNKATKDAIRKMLDQIAELNRAANP